MKKLSPEDNVLVVGNCTAPQTCIKKDEVALKKFFPTRINIPLPDYASRRVCLTAMRMASSGHAAGLMQDLAGTCTSPMADALPNLHVDAYEFESMVAWHLHWL